MWLSADCVERTCIDGFQAARRAGLSMHQRIWHLPQSAFITTNTWHTEQEKSSSRTEKQRGEALIWFDKAEAYPDIGSSISCLLIVTHVWWTLCPKCHRTGWAKLIVCSYSTRLSGKWVSGKVEQMNEWKDGFDQMYELYFIFMRISFTMLQYFKSCIVTLSHRNMNWNGNHCFRSLGVFTHT